MLSVTEGKELIRLCEAGRLYEIEAWIRAGKSLVVPREVRKKPLAVAIATGFHSLVELLLRHEGDQEAKNELLREALLLDRPAFVELALAYGADVKAVPFLDALMTGDRAVVTLFLERGADPITGYPFAHAFHELRAKTTLGSYLDCRRNRPDLADALQEQADMALRQFCQEGSLKWVCLLLWAGANPRSRGPALDDAEHAANPEWHTTALDEASASENVEILKKLKPSAGDDLSGLLRRAAFLAHREVIEYLLDLGANPNDKPDGGSTALEESIKYLWFEDFDRVQYRLGPNYLTPAHKVSKGREAIKLLLERGAMWTPDASTLNKTRRILYRLEPAVTVELIALLLKKPNGEEEVRELLRVAQMREHLKTCERELQKAGITLEGKRYVKRVEDELASWMLRFDRQQLYEEVWSAPTQQVAKRYGISDAAIGKVCRCLKIPKPPRGYWAKKAAGRRVNPPPKLPPVGDRSAAKRRPNSV